MKLVATFYILIFYMPLLNKPLSGIWTKYLFLYSLVICQIHIHCRGQIQNTVLRYVSPLTIRCLLFSYVRKMYNKAKGILVLKGALKKNNHTTCINVHINPWCQSVSFTIHCFILIHSLQKPRSFLTFTF